mgnify:CR=1 FL=1
MQVRRLIQILDQLPNDAEILIATDEALNECKHVWNIMCKYYDSSEKIIIIPDDSNSEVL